MTIMINKYEMTHNNPPNPMSMYYYSERGSFLPNSSNHPEVYQSLTRPPPNEGRSHVRNKQYLHTKEYPYSQQQHRDLQTQQQQETKFMLHGNPQHVITPRLASDRFFEREDEDSHNDQLVNRQRTHVTISEFIGMLVNVDEIVCADTSGGNVDTSDTLNRQASIDRISCRLVPHHRQQVIHDLLTSQLIVSTSTHPGTGIARTTKSQQRLHSRDSIIRQRHLQQIVFVLNRKQRNFLAFT